MLPKKETLTIEFKSDIKKLSDSEIFEAVVAFANTEGGELYLGIEDNGEVKDYIQLFVFKPDIEALHLRIKSLCKT